MIDPTAPSAEALIARIDAALPQTQCQRCGYPDCASYARAIALDSIPISQCPPGGQTGIARLAAITGLTTSPLPSLNPANGIEGPVTVARIDEDGCIGCTLCIKVCPTDAIIGTNKRMHTVIAADCTGCELCIPACPVDCIQLLDTSPGQTGWDAWQPSQATRAQARYQARQQRLAQAAAEQADRLAELTV